jgi:outer membrane protein assembly factor BamB
MAAPAPGQSGSILRLALAWCLAGVPALAALPAHGDVVGSGTVRVSVATRGPQSPMLLGDERHTGISRFDAPRAGEVAWRGRLLGGLIGSPAADAQGNLYFATQSGWLHVFKPDGSGERRIQLSAGTHSTPAITNSGLIIVPSRDGMVTAYTQDLTSVWVTSLGKELLSSPAIDRRTGTLVVSASDVTVGLDTATGAVRFRWSAGNSRNNSTPTIAPDGNVRITNWGGFAVSLDPSGNEVWRARLGAEGFWSSPTLGPRGEMYTAGATDRVVVALSPQGRELWRQKIARRVSRFMAQLPSGGLLVPNQPLLQPLDPARGIPGKSAAIAGGSGSTTPAVSRDGVVFMGTSNAKLVAVDGDRTLWSVSLPSPMEGAPIVAAAADGRSRVVAVDISGNVVCVE